MGRRSKKKHWRKLFVNNLLPARFQLVQYESLIKKIVSVARGETIEPRDIYKRFHRSLKTKLFSRGQVSANYPLIIKTFTDNLLSLQTEDLTQQCYLYLMELWDFYTFTWSKHGAASTTVFYDYARAQLSRWIGTYVALEIRKATSEAVPFLEASEIEEPGILKLDLSWVVLKNNDGIFNKLSVKQKYLLYLRFSKELTIEEISVLINQHRANIEQEFSTINSIIHGG